jgi:hypothetical protein
MSNPELTVPSILRKFDQTGKVPEEMFPIEPFNGGDKHDPTKPLRASFEGILLARAASSAIQAFSHYISQNEGKPWMGAMIPIEEIDEEDDFEDKVYLLTVKETFVVSNYTDKLEQAIAYEFDETQREALPRGVAFAYKMLDDDPEGISSASGALQDEILTLFHIASRVYPRVLGYNPTARQMVNLVANSYPTFIHIHAARHAALTERQEDFTTPMPFDEELEFNKNYTIDMSGENHAIVLLNPGQYIRIEEEMRREGIITSQTTHCPFSISSRFTEPFLDSDVEPFETNPLRHTFETLVKDFIGS